MRKKFVYITAVFIAFILILILFNIKDDSDHEISNLPVNEPPTFKKLTRKTSEQLSTASLSNDDYTKLMNIDFTFRILPLVCQNTEPLLLIVIHSAPRHFENRKVIRLTWATNGSKKKLLFMIGSPDQNATDSSELQNQILEESRNFRDIIQGSFVDSYSNLTYKHVMAYKYTIYHCNHTKLVLKTDDDVFVNINNLLNYIYWDLPDYGVEKLLLCNLWDRAMVRRSYRSKYRVSFDEYSAKTFPVYCSGWFILYSPDVVFSLYQEAQKSQYFWIDDVFLTGILAKRLNITHYNIKNQVIPRENFEKILNGQCDQFSAEFILGRPNMETESISKLWSCVQKWMA
ncbi:hypothetical protein WA026_018404 [Henosepilachna vigintioctopunctata]|uniref:Hexosyltransferase n=1 Tax=Henosepilachna vigintioctopunctata TaxID=420089 RepID=A0AAW1UTF4_9CUCU